jgi:hypothetical protein
VVDERTKVVVSHGMGNYSMLRTLVSLGPLNPHLVVLNLAGSGINAESAMEFARGAHKWVALETLNLARNRMGPEGAKPLAKALLSMNRLKSLNMMDIACMADGARALAKSLRRMHTIVSLQMAKNQVGAEGAKALATSVHDMERLEEFCINKFALPVKHLKGEGGEEMNFSSQEIQYEDVIIISFLLKGSRGSLHTINFANNGTRFVAYHTPYTIHHTPYTIHHTPHTPHTPYTIHHTPHTPHTPSTIYHAAVCEKEPGLVVKPRAGRSADSMWGLDSLFTAVRNSSVQVLDLSNNAIGVDGCEIVGSHVSQGLPVSVLKLGNNQLCGKRRDLIDHWQGEHDVSGELTAL